MAKFFEDVARCGQYAVSRAADGPGWVVTATVKPGLRAIFASRW
ncbi:hypothetical protein Rleg10DRAFT_3511 [Rhizobium leguminosarum bv. trifolii WSM2012]|nr:hypothetical protein Rleg10DRAFT_3511 [Rhizobium leguminosarum bv. trifolii WSM2012]